MGCRWARLYHDQILLADEGCELAFSDERISLTCRRILQLFGSQITHEKGRGSVVGERVSRKGKLSCFAHGSRLKVRKRHANESNAFEWGEYQPDQAKGELMQLLPGLDRHLR
jgi:hypothetical protein